MVNTNLDAVDKEKWMRLALAEAKAEVLHEVPIGAVVVLEGEVIEKDITLEKRHKMLLHMQKCLQSRKPVKKLEVGA